MRSRGARVRQRSRIQRRPIVHVPNSATCTSAARLTLSLFVDRIARISWFPAANSLGARGCGITVPLRTRGLGNWPPAPRSPSHWPKSFPPGGTNSRFSPRSRASSVRLSRSRESGTFFPRGTQTSATALLSPSRTATNSTSASLVSIADTVTPRLRFLRSRTFRLLRPA
jgi:hypothetical protein